MKGVERAAYHEAGHLVVAVIKRVEVGTLGILIDDCGHGYTALRLRPPGASPDYPISREASIVVLFAGLMSEKEFDSECTGKSASCDLARIRELEHEEHQLMEVDSLRLESERLVRDHWVAVEHLAKALLAKDYNSRENLKEQNEEKRWSGSLVARRLPPDEIVVILAGTMPSYNVQLKEEQIID